MPLELDAKFSALILIDLQAAIVSRDTKPHAAGDVVKTCADLAAKFRKAGATVVYVNVDLSNMITLPVDSPTRDPNAPPPPAEASQIVPAAGLQAGDLLITKRQWGAFFGTDLESKLRERGVKTVVLAGIATNYGVESTGRASAGLGFATVFIEDAMTTMTAELHDFAIKQIFPRLGRVRQASDLVLK